MKNRKVIKIGGSNLKKKEDIIRISEIISSYEKPPVVVVSAFYGITDKLITIYEKIVRDNSNPEPFVIELACLKQEYIIDIITDENIRSKTWQSVSLLLDELLILLSKINEPETKSLGIKDLVLSYGERLSATVICGCVSDRGNQCELAFPEKIGLITDRVIGNASVDLVKSGKNLQNYFKPGYTYIVPGFYGITNEKEVRLLGRGGTDYSAAAIAWCIKAESLDIWKDVDGFMTADPKFVDNPAQIKHLSYSEAAELAYFGAGILHPRTVEPLQISNIPIQIFNIYKDSAFSKPQTIIDEKITIFPEIIKSLTFENSIGILTINGPGVGFILGILSEITRILSDNFINISSVITSQIAINLLIRNNDIDKAQELINNLDIHAITNITIEKNVTLIAVVGNGMTKSPGIAAKVFSAIAEEGINILLSSLGASDVVSYFIVHKNDKEKAISKLHETLFINQLQQVRSIA